MSDSDHQRSQSPVNETERSRSRSREAERGRPLRRQATTPFAFPYRPNSPAVDQRFQPDGYANTPGVVYNAPALPVPPLFNGSIKSERWTFIRQYNKYLD
ncbi:hypothetical protein B5M09_013681 [Aphanomyces astaci]|uniref:Uncharacterized protein n=1 Tax=Aphanomyces astaci TaxID=112090 RepID=A0A3R7XW33_APHAT|nr:hypothetical protein B5M09_013681 [Aphanomyces astaci]